MRQSRPSASEPPRPDFLGGQLVKIGKVHGSRIRVRIPDAHERFAAAVDKQRHRSFGVILDYAEVIAVGFDWPGLHFAKSVAGREAHGILNSRIVPHLHSGIVPPIETMPHVAAIIQRDSLFEHRRTRTQESVLPSIAFRTRGRYFRPVTDALPSSFFGERKIHRRGCDPVMRDRKIELDSKRRPRSAIRDCGFLDGRIFVETSACR